MDMIEFGIAETKFSLGENKSKIEYLLNFYSQEELFVYLNGSEELLISLYNDMQPEYVEIHTLENNYDNCYVTSPDGWVPIIDCVKKKPKDILTFEMENGRKVNASTDHLFQEHTEKWSYARNLKIGDSLITDLGNSRVKNIKEYGKEEVYDLSIDHPNHRYYTNGICSHNTGKSLFLQNLAVNWCLMGLNVLYVTLELSENLVSLRLDAMFTKETTKDVVKDIDNAALKLLSIKKGKTETGIKPGRIQIKKFSEAGTTVNDIRAYIKEFEVQTGLKIDALCLDYLDLLYPNSAKVDINNTFSKDKYTSEELRGLAAELNILCVTASQLNRCLTLDTEVMWIDPSTPITEYRKTKKKLSEIQIGDYILGNNDFVEVVNIYNQGTQKVYKVTLENGKEIKCTSNHRFLTDKGLISIDEGMDVGVNLITYRSFKPTYRSLVLEKHVTTEYSAIENIEYYGLEDTIDIEVLSESNLFYANDILTHNSSVTETDYDVSHIAGGISKINTADNVIAILTTEYLRQSGEYQIQFLKTRSSNGVGSRIYLSYDQKSLKIDDKIEGNTDPTSNKKDNEKLSDMLEKRLLSKKKTTEEPKNKEIKTEIIEKPKEAVKDSRLDIIKKLSNKE